MQFKILTYNNGVGIVTDAILLKELIKINISENIDIVFVGENNVESADIGIWIQNYDLNLLNRFKKNIFFINEEWAGINELSNLHLFDYVICKSKYAKNLLSEYKNVTYVPFISKNYYDPNITRHNYNLHFAGRSIQKNTELVLSSTEKLTLIDPYNRYLVNKNIRHINTYQSTDELIQLLNSHTTHICCSLYESWGHYLYEGLSTGNEIICSNIPTFTEQLDPDLVHFIPTIDKIDYAYRYCKDNKDNIYPLRKAFFVDQYEFTNIIQNFVPIGKNEERKKLFKHIVNESKNKLINFFNSI